MSKYKQIASRIDKSELMSYYSTHLPTDTCRKFGIESLYLLHRVLDYLGIPERSSSETTVLQMKNMTDDERYERGRKIASSNTGRVVSPETREKISSAQKNKPRLLSPNFKSYQFSKGHVPWNKGKIGVQHWVDGQAERRWNTMLNNGTVGNFKTKIESQVEQDLINRFGEEHVHYQYSDSRYPFRCDFYVDTEDLFIEVNSWWHHGPHPYDENSLEDEELLNRLKSKAELHPEQKQWLEAIRIWTQRDVQKAKVAQDNNLNYIAIYSYNNEFK